MPSPRALWPPYTCWRRLAHALRARHARHVRRHPLTTVLRAAAALFQPRTIHLSSPVSITCLVSLAVTPRSSASAPSALRRRDTRPLAAGLARVFTHERIVERAAAHRARMIRRLEPGAMRLLVRDREPDRHASTTDAAAWPQAAAPGLRQTVRTSGQRATTETSERAVVLHRRLLRSEEATETWRRLVRQLGRQDMPVTPVTTVTRRAELRPTPAPAPAADRQTAEWSMAMSSAMPGRAAADVDIEALTSRVMHQIDRRLIAHRERLGRV